MAGHGAHLPSAKDIVDAVLGSGYLMEQQIATRFERLGFHVQTNRPFEDVDEGKSREIDISAIKQLYRDDQQKISGYIEFISECKNNSQPFVFLGRPKNETDRNRTPTEYLFPIREYTKIIKMEPRTVQGVPAFNHLDLASKHYYYGGDTKAVQFFKVIWQQNRWQASHDGVMDGIFYPMAKALQARQRDVPRPRNNTDWRYLWLFFPVVVLSGPIYYIDTSDTDPQPTQVRHVTFQRELKSKNLSGSFTVDFIAIEALEEYVLDSVMPFVTYVADLFQHNAETLRNEPMFG